MTHAATVPRALRLLGVFAAGLAFANSATGAMPTTEESRMMVASPAAFEPAIVGVWQAGDLLFMDRATPSKISMSPSTATRRGILPAGLRVRFEKGAVAGEAVSSMALLPPWPADACRNELLRDSCDDTGSVPVPPPSGRELEFSLDVQRVKSARNRFAAVGAKPGDAVYGVILDGHLGRWDFFVPADRRLMFSRVFLPRALWPLAADGRQAAEVYQVFTRLQ